MRRSAPSFLLFCAFILLLGAPAARADNYVTSAIHATFKIANPGSTATCFVIACPAQEDPSQTDLVLVTAGHVLEKMKGDTSRLVLRKEQEDGTFVRHEITINIRDSEAPLWIKHPDVDVAAMRLEVPDTSLIQPIPLTSVVDAEAIAGGLCQSGDELRMLSYPAQVEANGAGFPIVRRGALASFPLAPVAAHRTFLVDFNTFAGDSGGPVVRPAPQLTEEERGPTLVLGLVIGQHIHEERYKLTYEETLVRHRLGIGIAVHAEFIRQTIERLRKSDAK